MIDVKFKFGTQEKYNGSNLLEGELGFITNKGRLYYGASNDKTYLIGEDLTKLTVGDHNTIKDSCVALGKWNNVDGDSNIAFNVGNTISGKYNVVFNGALDPDNTVEDGNKVDGTCNVVLGNNNVIEAGTFNFVGGKGNSINGTENSKNSFIYGTESQINSSYSVILGNNCNIANNKSIAIGNHLESSNESQIILGKYNAENSNALFIVGGGDSTNNKRNVFWADPYGIQVCENDENGAGYVRNIHYGTELPDDNTGKVGDVYLYIGE